MLRTAVCQNSITGLSPVLGFPRIFPLLSKKGDLFQFWTPWGFVPFVMLWRNLSFGRKNWIALNLLNKKIAVISDDDLSYYCVRDSSALAPVPCTACEASAEPDPNGGTPK